MSCEPSLGKLLGVRMQYAVFRSKLSCMWQVNSVTALKQCKAMAPFWTGDDPMGRTVWVKLSKSSHPVLEWEVLV